MRKLLTAARKDDAARKGGFGSIGCRKLNRKWQKGGNEEKYWRNDREGVIQINCQRIYKSVGSAK